MKTLRQCIGDVLDFNECRCLDDLGDRTALADDLIQSVSSWLAKRDGWFPVMQLHRDNLRALGYDITDVDDAMMSTIANELLDACWGRGLLDDLAYIADKHGLGKLETSE